MRALSSPACAEWIRDLVDRGGPTPSEYAWLNTVLEEAHQGSRDGVGPQLKDLRWALGTALSPQTMQGFAFCKPHGYAGDFEIIDRIYVSHVTPVPQVRNWDVFFHEAPAACAVRNRKTYFKRLLSERHVRGSLNVLNVASGPGRDMYEYLCAHGPDGVAFDCLEKDPAAIHHAEGLCAPFPGTVQFLRGDVLRFRPQRTYDLVWSAGLFDYFDDRIFKKMLLRLMGAVAPGGELVIGNFSEVNPSQAYMSLMSWDLHHRSADHLRTLALECGTSAERVRIEWEPLRINLFLRIHRAT